MKRGSPMRHGEPRMYDRGKCRCDLCRGAIREQRARLAKVRLCSRCDLRPRQVNHSWCRTCAARAQILRIEEDPERPRRESLKQKFGLTMEAYESMLAGQGGVCAICATPPGVSPKGRRLAVDHDHATGKIRGLLCGDCNNGVGRFKDDPGLLERAISYLREGT